MRRGRSGRGAEVLRYIAAVEEFGRDDRSVVPAGTTDDAATRRAARNYPRLVECEWCGGAAVGRRDVNDETEARLARTIGLADSVKGSTWSSGVAAATVCPSCKPRAARFLDSCSRGVEVAYGLDWLVRDGSNGAELRDGKAAAQYLKEQARHVEKPKSRKARAKAAAKCSASDAEKKPNAADARKIAAAALAVLDLEMPKTRGGVEALLDAIETERRATEIIAAAGESRFSR